MCHLHGTCFILLHGVYVLAALAFALASKQLDTETGQGTYKVKNPLELVVTQRGLPF